ncbi:MAG: TonB-dependent receptor [Bacteroidetes bacterium]|nr:TonB-dependent receptor [Bacteroidota bacterium]
MSPSTVRPAVFLVALISVWIWQPVHAQKSTLSGTLTDGQSGEMLIGANVLAVTMDKGTASNTYGFYSLTLPTTDSLTVLFSYIGYHPQLKKIYLTDDIVLDVQLEPARSVLGEVTVEAERANADNVRRTQMGVVDVSIRAIERLPAILGEQDVLKVIQLLPGVQTGEEGTTGFHVRGGNVDQNLIQLDEATIYNPSHLFGLFSTFNTRALNNVQLIKGGFPAYYGGRLSSALQITMREGNRRTYEAQGGVGVTSAQFTVEGPIKKDKASFILSGRRSYIDLIIRPFQKSKDKNLYYFYDFNAKLNYQPSRKDRVYFSLFTGRDDAAYIDASSLGYGTRFGNSTATLRWNHLFGNKLFSNTSLIRNKYFIRVNTIQGQFFSQNYSGIEDLTAKTELQYYPNPAHHIRLGAILTRHVFSSTGSEGYIPEGGVTSLNPTTIPERESTEYAFYVNDRWEISDRFGINVGLRVPYFSERDTSYLKVEPRLSIKVGLDDASSVKASYTVMNQFVHLVPTSNASIPTDIWAPSSRITKPQYARQVALGYFRNFKDNQYEGSVELYYKEMENQVRFQEGTKLLAYDEIEQVLTFGRGWSYGAEVFLKRNYGRLAGWLSYTLAWTNQRFAALNNGEKFPFKYDRRHNLALVLTYDMNPRWSLSGNFVFRSGSAYTLPVGRLYASQGGALYNGLFFDYESVNNYRLAVHHRIDVAATYHLKPNRYFKESNLVFSVYNVYSRLNPYFVFLDLDTATGEPVATQVTLLPIVPSVTFNFKF